MSNERRIAVIGGGITGLAAAERLVEAGTRVIVFEAGNRVGGVIRTSPFAGHPAIDEGADAFLARVPWAVDLARTVGLADSLTSPASAKAAVWWDGLHDIPENLMLGVPTGVAGLARSPLLSLRGKLRAASEVLRPRSDPSADSIGSFVRRRFGDEVHERLVDPLIGSIYAADTDDFSLAAVPQLADLASGSRSVLLRTRRRAATPTGPVFYAPTSGMGAFVDAVATSIVAGGGELRCDAAVSEMAADGSGWRVDGVAFDGVVVACPARHAATLLSSIDAGIATTLRAVPTAGVALLTLAIPIATWPERLRGLSGYLIPKPRQRLVTAVSFGSQKWAHWADPEHIVLRVSLGRDGLPALHLDDDRLRSAALDELKVHLGLEAQPTAVRVSRWPDSFPQYRPHHGEAIAAAERSLPEGIALAGASYHGIGVPACIRSGRQAAALLLQR